MTEKLKIYFVWARIKAKSVPNGGKWEHMLHESSQYTIHENAVKKHPLCNFPLPGYRNV